MLIKPESHVVTLGWMRTELGLKGNELTVYAIIYGFSQTKDQKFTGSLQYLADWCGATKQGIIKNLQSLIDRGLIEKTERIKNGVKFCEYSCIVFNYVERGIEHSLINNIEYKKSILSKDKNTSKNGNFLGSIKNKPKKNLYSQCISLIDNFIATNNCIDIRSLLIQHLDLIVEEKKLRGQKQYQGILNKLQQSHEAGSQYRDIIMYSIEHGYPTFYEINKSYSKGTGKRFTESGDKHIESFTEEDRKNLDEFKKQLKKEGKQIYF